MQLNAEESPEKLAQAHRLWNLFLGRLSSRALSFGDVVLQDKTKTLEELSFTIHEIGVIHKEWVAIHSLMQNHQNRCTLSPSPETFSLLSEVRESPDAMCLITTVPRREVLESWEILLGDAFAVVEQFASDVDDALVSVHDSAYQVALYADFLVDQVAYSSTKVTKYDEMGRIKNRANVLQDRCRSETEKLQTHKTELTKRVLPWLLNSLRAIRAAIAADSLRGVSVSPSILNDLSQVNDLSEVLPSIGYPRINPIDSTSPGSFLLCELSYITIRGQLAIPGIKQLKSALPAVIPSSPSPERSTQELLTMIAETNCATDDSISLPDPLSDSDNIISDAAITGVTFSLLLLVTTASTQVVSLLVDSEEFLLPGSHVFGSVIIQNGGCIRTRPWNGQSGGSIDIKCDTIIIESGGSIILDGLGYRGGEYLCEHNQDQAQQGESDIGEGTYSTACNNSGGGGGSAQTGRESGGGGGGGAILSGTSGRSTTAGGKGGSQNSKPFFMGAGGGGGHPFAPLCDSDTGSVSSTASHDTFLSQRVNTCIKGGNGGGCLLITTSVFENNGTISCNGTPGDSGPTQGTSGGGGGSGGCIQIKCSERSFQNSGSIQCRGGIGGLTPTFHLVSQRKTPFSASGGAGSDGLIVLPSNNKTIELDN